MTDLLDEVLRDQSDEKKLRFFKTVLPFVIGLAIIIVILMIVNSWYQDSKIKENKELGDIFIKAINNSNEKTVDEVLKHLPQNSSSNKIGELALLKQAGIRVNNGDIEGAKTLFQEIASNKEVESTTSSFARIAWLSLVIDQPNIDEKDKETLQEYLKYYTNESQEFFGTASILKALWFEKNNQDELAKEVLITLKSLENIPASIKKQATALLSRLELKN